MRVPVWLNTALEGGVLELQRALVRYRRLRRALSHDWRARASAVAEQCEALKREEPRVEHALERALKRARCDPRAGAATHLAVAIERERRAVRKVLLNECGARGSLSCLLEQLAEAAREESLVESAWARFNVERVSMTLAVFAAGAALPLTSWWSASHGGFVPVLFDLAALVELPLGPLVLGALLAVAWLRVASWRWLGLTRPLLGSAAGSALCIATGLLGGVASVAHNVPLFALVVGLLTMLALALLASMWRVPRVALLAE